MSRRKKEDSVDDVIVDMGVFLVLGGAFWLFMKFRSNKEEFWYHIGLPTLLVIVIATGLYFYWRKHKARHFADLLKQIEEKGLGENTNNFITQNGREKSKTNVWSYRDCTFDEKNIEDFRGFLIDQGVKVSLSDLHFILQRNIDDKKKLFVIAGITSTSTHHFSELMDGKGDKFEYLIARLYEAMGYSTKRNGGSGDQGADVIANKDGEHILIQAKCWEGGVSNHAVQEAYTGLSIHGCNKAVVITTSFFQPGAEESAKSNSVELIGKERLREMLAEYLHESWS
jgi:hypothetical protein